VGLAVWDGPLDVAVTQNRALGRCISEGDVCGAAGGIEKETRG
jgi:hypothetical protein